MTGHFLLPRPMRGASTGVTSRGIPVGPLRTASRYSRRFSAAFGSRSSSTPLLRAAEDPAGEGKAEPSPTRVGHGPGKPPPPKTPHAKAFRHDGRLGVQ